MAPERKVVDQFVTLEISSDNPEVKKGLAKIGTSLAKWKKDLETGRRKARAIVDAQRRQRGHGSV